MVPGAGVLLSGDQLVIELVRRIAASIIAGYVAVHVATR